MTSHKIICHVITLPSYFLNVDKKKRKSPLGYYCGICILQRNHAFSILEIKIPILASSPRLGDR